MRQVLRGRGSPNLSIQNEVRLRQEYFGGILFHAGIGTTMEVDREAFRLAALIQAKGIVNINELGRIWFEVYNKHLNLPKALQVIEKLLELKMLSIMPPGILHLNSALAGLPLELPSAEWPTGPVLRAPETVHWAVTFRCDLTCPDCYVRRHRHFSTRELNTAQSLDLIDRFAEAGVFQLAIGGGEPFIRGDLLQLAAQAKSRGIVVHVTTGRYQLETGVLKELGKSIRRLQVGIKHYELMRQPETEREKLHNLIEKVRDQGIDIGANLILSRSTIRNFTFIVEELAKAGFRRITLLRYKPSGLKTGWVQEKPDSHEILSFEDELTRIVDTYSHIKFRVDCGLAFLQRDLSPEQAKYSGIRGCTAAERILSVAPDGSVYPCSQLVGPDFWAGRLPEGDFTEVWTSSVVLRKYRKFRTNTGFKESRCGRCNAKIHCGGCRVFAMDALGPDPGCPYLNLAPGKPGAYPWDDHYAMLLEIQETIGYTEGGFPLATLEEIEDWLEKETHRDYPRWLMSKE